LTLHNQAKNQGQQITNFYLLRHSSTLICTDNPHILSVFTFSWNNGSSAQHIKIFITEFGQLYFPKEGNKQQIIESWYQMWPTVANDFKLNPNKGYMVLNDDFEKLERDKYIELSTPPNIPNTHQQLLTELDGDTTKFKFQ